MNNYRCDICGCYLDPGERRMCEDCQRTESKKVIGLNHQIFEQLILEGDKEYGEFER